MQCSGGIFLLGGGNLTRSNFDHSENCYLVGGDKNLVGGGIFPGGGGMSKFLAGGGGLPPSPPVGKTLFCCLVSLAEWVIAQHLILMCYFT